MLLVHRAANLEAAAGIAHGFFGRTGGVSVGVYASLNCGPGSADSREHIVENRRRALVSLDHDARLVTVHQIHGNRAVRVTAPWEIGRGPEADAMASSVPHIALGILTADCVPVLLADASARVIGAAHAGWKGALAGVVDAAVVAMEELGARRERIAAAIGPAISQANYEVGSELQSAFLERRPEDGRFFVRGERAGRFQFDLEGLVAERLWAARIGSIERLSLCTYERESELFSYRRATHRGEKDNGRQISMIVLCK